MSQVPVTVEDTVSCLCYVCCQERRGGDSCLLGPAERTLLYLQMEPVRHWLPLHHLYLPPCEERQWHIFCSLWCKLTGEHSVAENLLRALLRCLICVQFCVQWLCCSGEFLSADGNKTPKSAYYFLLRCCYKRGHSSLSLTEMHFYVAAHIEAPKLTVTIRERRHWSGGCVWGRCPQFPLRIIN